MIEKKLDISNLTSSPKMHIITFGCQMNEHDSERMASLLEDQGFSWTDEVEQADLILINSCTIRKKAEEKAFSHAGRLKRLKRRNPRLKIGFCGCVAQREKENIFERAPHIDIVFGTLNIPEMPNLVNELWEKDTRICHVRDVPQSHYNHTHKALRCHPVKAWVTIMEGCNNFCTYCVVPYVRGRERSRLPQEIIEEVLCLVKSGYKEITLLGQNVNSYGKGLEPPMDFAGLLFHLNEVSGLERIRFTTSHPKDLSKDLIYAIRDCKHVCEHIHLPLQAGSDTVLKRMGRGYTLKEYLKKVDDLRKDVPGIAITGDMICGFPGETEKDFEQTMQAVEHIRFDGLFSFKYSQRPQTSAAQLSGQIPEDIKLKRLQLLQRLQNQICGELNAEMVGGIHPILVEGVSKKDPNKLTGRTRTNKVVNISDSTDLVGKTVKVKIIRSKPFDLEGEYVKSL